MNWKGHSSNGTQVSGLKQRDPRLYGALLSRSAGDTFSGTSAIQTESLLHVVERNICVPSIL